MMQRPYDMMVMAGVILLIVITGSFFVADIRQEDSTINDTFFVSANDLAGSSSGFKGVSDSSANALSGLRNTTDEANEGSFIIRGAKALLGLGQSWAVMQDLFTDASESLGIPSIYITIVLGMLLTAFLVVMYNWWKGN